METAGTYKLSHSLKCWHSNVGLFQAYTCAELLVYTGTLTIAKLHKLSIAYSTADIAYASLSNVSWSVYTHSTLSQTPVCKCTGDLLFYFRFLPASISYWLCSIIIHGELRTMVFCPLSLRNFDQEARIWSKIFVSAYMCHDIHCIYRWIRNIQLIVLSLGQSD